MVRAGDLLHTADACHVARRGLPPFEEVSYREPPLIRHRSMQPVVARAVRLKRARSSEIVAITFRMVLISHLNHH